MKSNSSPSKPARRSPFAALMVVGVLLVGTLGSPDETIDEGTQAADALGAGVFTTAFNVQMVADDMVTQMSLVSIAEAGANVTVLIPATEALSFDLVVLLRYLASEDLGPDPVPLLYVVDEAGIEHIFVGEVNIHNDPNSEEVSGAVDVLFADVEYARTGGYTLFFSWEPGSAYVFDPADITGFDITPLNFENATGPFNQFSTIDPSGVGSRPPPAKGTKPPSPTPSPPAQPNPSPPSSPSPPSGPDCRTHVNARIGQNDHSVSSSTSGGNVWKTYAKLNYNVDISWYGGCNSAGPGHYGTGTGYAISVNGPNEAARGGVYLMDIALAHMGGGRGTGSPDGFGYKEVYLEPSIRLQKPYPTRIELEDTNVLGLNQKSCTNWPTPLVDALALVPTNYWWSVVIHFSTKTYCTTNWSSFDSGPTGNLNWAGFKITKRSVTVQYETGGRISFWAGEKGEFEMPFTYKQHSYGTVAAHGNQATSFNLHAPVTTSVMPRASVV